MSEPAWNHRYVEVNGIEAYYVRHSTGSPLILWHGCSEFWLVWRKNILPLAESFEVVVPDLRGLAEALGFHEEAGHFVHYERPELANWEITEFFREIW